MAVLEEEIVRLEEKVVDLRQDLYDEAVQMSSSRRRMEHSPHFNNANPIGTPKLDKFKSFPQTVPCATNSTTPPPGKHYISVSLTHS